MTAVFKNSVGHIDFICVGELYTTKWMMSPLFLTFSKFFSKSQLVTI